MREAKHKNLTYSSVSEKKNLLILGVTEGSEGNLCYLHTKSYDVLQSRLRIHLVLLVIVWCVLFNQYNLQRGKCDNKIGQNNDN